MGFFSTLLSMLTKAADNSSRYVRQQSDDYYSGYDRGAQQASKMTDDELKSELRRAKENGVSGMGNAGKTRAMADEYKNRNNK